MPRYLVLMNASVFAVCLPYLGVPLWKAVVVAFVAGCCTLMRYGGNTITRVGTVTLGLTMAIWLGLVPALQEWPNYVKSARSVTGLASLQVPQSAPVTSGLALR